MPRAMKISSSVRYIARAASVSAGYRLFAKQQMRSVAVCCRRVFSGVYKTLVLAFWRCYLTRHCR